MLVRDARATDVESIGSVHGEAWRVAYAAVFDDKWLHSAVADRRDRWATLQPRISASSGDLLVAEDDGQVTGFLHGGPTDDPRVGEVFALYVLPARWGSAAASLLMLEGLGRLRSAGCDEVALWTMAAADRARAFYEKAGWTHDGSTQMHDFGDGRERVLLRYVAP